MKRSQLLAQALRAYSSCPNWTSVSFKDTLADVDYDVACYHHAGFHNILELVYHIYYYMAAINEVLDGKPLTAHDNLSFNHPPITDQHGWEQFLMEFHRCADELVMRVEALPEEKMDEPFFGEQYGTYFRNLQGVLEHAYYHLGQITFLKKMAVAAALKTP